MRAAAIGFIFQTFNLIPTLSAHENVETALVPLGGGQAERRRRWPRPWTASVSRDRAGHLPSELSGGQQQRVAIARALVKEPKVLLADEPTGNLDEETRDEIIALIEKLWRERGLTLILVSHDGAVTRRAQRVAVDVPRPPDPQVIKTKNGSSRTGAWHRPAGSSDSGPVGEDRPATPRTVMLAPVAIAVFGEGSFGMSTVRRRPRPWP